MSWPKYKHVIKNITTERPENRKLNVGDSVLLLLPTERNKLTLAWRGPYKVVGVVGEVDYRIQISPDKVKTYHINMLKRYFYRDNDAASLTANKSQNNTAQNKDNVSVEQVASVACVRRRRHRERSGNKRC